jgi:hypothetical protein
MALLFMDGFDKYGPINTASAVVAAQLIAEWTSWSVGGANIVAALSTSGYAAQVLNSVTATKTLSTNYARLIGGLRFAGSFGGQSVLIQFRDGATPQCSLTLETTGVIHLRTGNQAGVDLATGATVSVNSIHYVEWDITFGATASYQVWLDGVSLFSGTGNTRGGTTNNYANAIALLQAAVGTWVIDDLYLFDSTGTTNNAVLLTSPRVETTFPVSDSAVQFGFGAAILGAPTQRVAAFTAPVANTLYLRRFTPAVSCTLNSISIIPAATNGTASYRGVVYTDSSGAAGTLMSSGSTVIGITTGVALTLPLTTSQSLTAGTPYWLGFMDDTNANLQESDGNILGYRASWTFTSGAPATAPAMTSGQPSAVLWGNLSGISGANYYEVSQQPPLGAPSYVFDATVGHEDLSNFAPMSATPAVVYVMAVKAYCQKSDSGAKTASLRTRSGATDSGGSLTGQVLGTSYGWLSSYFPTDPNTSAAWTGASLNAATSGFRVDS